MSEELLNGLAEQIKEGNKKLATVKELIAKLKTAGENTVELERQYRVVKARLDRYKKAFS